MNNLQLPSAALSQIGLSPEVLNTNYFMDNSFFKEIFSCGPLHMAGVTMCGVAQFMFNDATIAIVKQNTILPYFMDRVESQPNLKRFHFFDNKNRYKFLDCTLDFTLHKKGKSNYIQFKDKDNHEPIISSISFRDLDFIEWLMRNNKRLDNSEDAKVVQDIAIDLLDRLAEVLITNFHTNIFRNRDKGKYGYSDEVIIRQTTMAFWAAISVRNLIRSDDFNKIDRSKVYDWKFGLAGPCNKFEELCNVINGTDHTVVSKVFTPEFTKKEYAGHVSVASAIVSAIKG